MHHFVHLALLDHSTFSRVLVTFNNKNMALSEYCIVLKSHVPGG